MHTAKATRMARLLVAVVFLLALGLAVGSIRWLTTPAAPAAPSAAKDADAANPAAAGSEQTAAKLAKSDQARLRDSVNPFGNSSGSTQMREDDLLTLEDYWSTRLTYPTGQFSMNWLLNADKQNRALPSAIPGGQVIYSRSAKSPLSLDPSRFIALGPQPEQTDGCLGCYNYGHVSGRVNDIKIDPVTPNVAYLASVGGGIWKTTNCCTPSTSWVSTLDDPLITTLSVDSIDIDPTNHNTVYVGTGDLNFGSFSMGSAGVLKSTNAGASWTVLGADVFNPQYPEPPGNYPQYQAIGKVRVDPRNSNNVVAGTKTGVYFSYNAGLNWTGPCYTNPYTATQRQDVTGLIMRSNGTSTDLYVAVGTRGYSTTMQYDLAENGANGLYKTTMPAGNCPASWTLLTTPSNGWPAGTGTGVPFHSGGDPLGRMDIAIAPSNPLYIYAQVQSIQTGGGYQTGGQLGLWRTTDGGGTWNKQSGPDALGGCGFDYNQNWYDQGLAVDPNNPNTLLMDTYDIWKSTDGGASFLDATCGYGGGTTQHVDQHAILYAPGSSSLVMAGSDGGAYVTLNADVISPTLPTWNQLNDSLNTIEFYSGDTTGNFATAPNPGANGGAQDNGSSVTTWNDPNALGPQLWQMRVGGDGFWSRTEPVLGQRWYQENNSGHIWLGTNGPYGPYNDITSGYTADTRSFVMPWEIYKYDCPPTGCTHMIVGTTRVWESTTGTGGWVAISPNLTKGTLGNRSYINQLTYAVSISTTAIVGTNDGNVQYGFGLGQGVAATWVNVTGGNTALPNRPVLDVTTDPVNPLVGYAAIGGFDENTPGTPGHVFQVTCTANCASFTWVNKTGNLPNIPIDSIIANPRYPQQVFAGSDWGLYFTNDITAASPTWAKFTAGLPNVMIWDMTIDRGFTTLSVWTRSRGAYVWPLPAGAFVQPSATPTVTGTPPTALPSATPTATATPGPCFLYNVITSTATIISGTTDIGNHCDDCATTVQLPFPVRLYDGTFTQGYASSDGSIMFGPATASLYNGCLPDRNQQYAIIPYQTDLCTNGCGGASCPTCGIYTATLGTAPNRQFVLEWRAIHYGVTEAPNDFEVVFNEGSTTITTIYGATTDAGANEVGGIQQSSDTRWTELYCNTPMLTPGLRVDYVQSACPTPTPGPSATRTPGVTATPTECPINFSDVPTEYWAYGYIKWAACNGIISGYGDGTFHPDANITRAQITKLIVLASGWTLLNPPAAHFTDVNPGYWAYSYIETAYAHNAISGYEDGTFRPGLYVTRAQIAKIVVIARGYAITIPTTPNFNDVPPSYWAFNYIETAFANNVIGGYDCLRLTPTPSPQPGQCREFRPANLATRAQFSKMLFQSYALATPTPGP
jgi:hypothetical protein